jgi:DNA-directed RNA polymerase specialized sigma24 family protein
MIWPSGAFRLLPVETDAPVAGFRRACASLRQGVPAPRSVQQLYQEKQLRQPQIAELAGCSISTVRHALDRKRQQLLTIVEEALSLPRGVATSRVGAPSESYR